MFCAKPALPSKVVSQCQCWHQPECRGQPWAWAAVARLSFAARGLDLPQVRCLDVVHRYSSSALGFARQRSLVSFRAFREAYSDLMAIMHLHCATLSSPLLPSPPASLRLPCS